MSTAATDSRAAAPKIPRHPSKWLADALELAAELLVAEYATRADRSPLLVLDPFAGVGGIHRLRELTNGTVQTVGLELEPEWSAAHPGTIAGDVLAMPAEWVDRFDAVVTSPCYGNRMADAHDARDASRRNTYRHALGRQLSPGSAAGMQWGREYRRFHRDAMLAVLRVLRPGGLIAWNVKNHYRAGVEQLVAEWHLRQWLELGVRLVRVVDVAARGNRQGENGDLRTEAEFVFVLRAPAGPPVLL